MSVAIVDSGGANLASVMFAVERLGRTFAFTGDPDIIVKASHVILPGVGTAGAVMRTLREKNLIDCIKSLTQPVLGLCVGMQVLFGTSAEGNVPMLGLIGADVGKLTPQGLPVPHMGWNTVKKIAHSPLLKGLDDSPWFYFVHSYCPPPGPYSIGITSYGQEFSSIVGQDNFFGCQFHPERSGKAGSTILKNFMEM